MKTLIAFSTTHGCTEKTSQELKEYFDGEVELINLKSDRNPKLEKFNRVIIGGSIHAGQVQKRVKEFCSKNINELKLKELGLFICCMEPGETGQKQLLDAYPEELHQVAKSVAVFGGEFDFEKMNFLEKIVVKKVAKVKKTTSKVDHEAIRIFSKRMDKVFNPFLFLV
ncbi:MAG: flavodoxin [Prolixibacteraceae bacterium]|jgi:menaquinone-dependent protoporphyrinogen oxidase|nr:flavodoxin [Prolixibacteraceae bacterium]MBT6005403.1 flavodoxin [Prolixibacteraceae bacterium]MBT6764522.1 flavodoxin [Prolixibacteraceae bacterium]MBT6997350.1 flavodoxin [Prolixibacteraceae bacterium]MBT7397539.1 flavodoxin [Prolixibacteraceae bacterium]